MCTLSQEQDCETQDHTRTRFHVMKFYSSGLFLTLNGYLDFKETILALR